MDQGKTPLLDAIVAYTKERPVYFKIPGHRYERGISPRWRQWTGDGIFQFDLTEAEGLDDLHSPEGVIKEAQELAAEVFGAKKTYFLVNGTTCGNEAMVLSCAGEGEKIMVARNAHKSVLMGLIMSGAQPVWLMPEFDEESGLCGSVRPETVEEEFQKHPECKGVFLVSPTYYGVCSDLEKISEICHRHGAVLLVDEAHGGHLYFGEKGRKTEELPRGAIQLGADLCAQSMHKVTGSLGQSSLLHVGSDRVNTARLESNLHLVQSTSPSYLLMTSLDAARYELAFHGKEMLGDALHLAQTAREQINRIPGMRCYGKELEEVQNEQCICQIDTTRLVISAWELGIGGYELADRLYREYQVGLELSDDKNAVAIVTYANTEKDIQRLLRALEQIAKTAGEQKQSEKIEENREWRGENLNMRALPPYVLTPRAAYFSTKKRIPWKEAVGKIAGEALIPYPPGIPLVNPGERITEEVWERMEICRQKGYHFHGPEDLKLDTIQIIPE